MITKNDAIAIGKSVVAACSREKEQSPDSRYTYKSLCSDVATINAELEKAGSDLYLEVGKRNGYIAVDVLSQDQHNYRKGLSSGHSGCLRMLLGGTPKKCFHAAETFYYQQLLEIERKKAS